MTQYAPLTMRFHKQLIENKIRLRLSDMDEILRKATEAMDADIQTGNLVKKDETGLYEYAYEPALEKHAEVNEKRRLYAALNGAWNGKYRRKTDPTSEN